MAENNVWLLFKLPIHTHRHTKSISHVLNMISLFYKEWQIYSDSLPESLIFFFLISAYSPFDTHFITIHSKKRSIVFLPVDIKSSVST